MREYRKRRDLVRAKIPRPGTGETKKLKFQVQNRRENRWEVSIEMPAAKSTHPPVHAPVVSAGGWSLGTAASIAH
jgi:hypothetical protein